MKPDPWAFTRSFGCEDMDTLMERHTDTIYQCLQALFNYHRGVGFDLPWRHVTRRHLTFKNGKPRKTPVFDYEDTIVAVKPEPTHPDDVPMSQGLEFIIPAVVEAMRAMAPLNKARHYFWLGRPKLVEYMKEMDAALHVTPRERGNFVSFDHAWEPAQSSPNTGVRPDLLNHEFLQFLPPAILPAFRPHLDQFKWTVVNGFIQDFECPQRYWQLMRHRLIPNEDTIVYTIGVLDGKRVNVMVDWQTPLVQPLFRVKFSDVPGAEPFVPGVRTEADTNAVLAPLLENLPQPGPPPRK